MCMLQHAQPVLGAAWKMASTSAFEAARDSSGCPGESSGSSGEDGRCLRRAVKEKAMKVRGRERVPKEVTPMYL